MRARKAGAPGVAYRRAMRGAAATSTVPPPCEKPISAIRPASMPGCAARVRSAAKERVERGAERLRRIERQVMGGAGNLDELGGGDRLEHARGHLERQDRRVLSANDEGRRRDTWQERPAVHRLAVRVAGRIEA